MCQEGKEMKGQIQRDHVTPLFKSLQELPIALLIEGKIPKMTLKISWPGSRHCYDSYSYLLLYSSHFFCNSYNGLISILQTSFASSCFRAFALTVLCTLICSPHISAWFTLSLTFFRPLLKCHLFREAILGHPTT